MGDVKALDGFSSGWLEDVTLGELLYVARRWVERWVEINLPMTKQDIFDAVVDGMVAKAAWELDMSVDDVDEQFRSDVRCLVKQLVDTVVRRRFKASGQAVAEVVSESDECVSGEKSGRSEEFVPSDQVHQNPVSEGSGQSCTVLDEASTVAGRSLVDMEEQVIDLNPACTVVAESGSEECERDTEDSVSACEGVSESVTLPVMSEDKAPESVCFPEVELDKTSIGKSEVFPASDVSAGVGVVVEESSGCQSVEFVGDGAGRNRDREVAIDKETEQSLSGEMPLNACGSREASSMLVTLFVREERKERAKGTQEAGHEDVVELIGRLKERQAEHWKDWLEESSIVAGVPTNLIKKAMCLFENHPG